MHANGYCNLTRVVSAIFGHFRDRWSSSGGRGSRSRVAQETRYHYRAQQRHPSWRINIIIIKSISGQISQWSTKTVILMVYLGLHFFSSTQTSGTSVVGVLPCPPAYPVCCMSSWQISSSSSSRNQPAYFKRRAIYLMVACHMLRLLFPGKSQTWPSITI